MSEDEDIAYRLSHTAGEIRQTQYNIMLFRTVIKLTHMLKAQMPRPNSIHKYSTGRMYANFTISKTKTGYKLVLSEGVPYSHYALGFKDDGSQRTARGPLERLNFKTIPKCINTILKMIKEGSVW